MRVRPSHVDGRPRGGQRANNWKRGLFGGKVRNLGHQKGWIAVAGVIPLADDDILSPGRWRDAVQFIREQGDVVYVQEVADALGN